MIELSIIKFLLRKEYYDKYRRYLKDEKDHAVFLTAIDKLMNSLSRDISFGEFKLTCLNLDGDLLPVLTQLEQEDISDVVAEDVVKQYCERQVGHELALKAIAVSEGKASLDECRDMLDGVCLQEALEQNDFYEGSPDDLLLALDRRTGGLRWRLKPVDNTLGGLRIGDFGFIFARPETGKTTFLASEISHFVTQTEQPVIWANNEEAKEKVRGRMVQGALGITVDQFQKYTEKCWTKFNKDFSHFKLYNSTPMHRRDVERIVKEYKPALLVIDQIDKIKGFKADRDDLLLGAIYQWARELAIGHCPVIGVCQAAATAEGKKWLGSDDIAKSKTEKLAEGDFVIGIGKSHDSGYEDTRYLHFIKNKLTGIHAKITCQIDPTIARYTE